MTTTHDTQLPLFTALEVAAPALAAGGVGDRAPHAPGSETSKAAAEVVAPRVRGQKLDILRALKVHDDIAKKRNAAVANGTLPKSMALEFGLTREELTTMTEHTLNAICGRLSEKETGLIPLGLVRVEGTRKGSSGVEQEVLHITDKGRAALEGASK